MRITILTLFPEMFSGVLSESIIKRALADNIVEIVLVNFRDYAKNKHKQVDDTPYGGGPGMVLSIEPIHAALASLPDANTAVKVLLTPQGIPYRQEHAKELALTDHLILICGHYEGFDERVRSMVDREISIGDYVLTGGEIPAMVLIDSIIRLLPGAISCSESVREDSFYDGMLDYPQYTRPYEFQGQKVPDVLISGNHQEIEKWRRYEAKKRTRERRPDLLKKPDEKD
ncbi:MAG: tRNA (guanosine(37)-N1)-methyltransferase TrmD [Candidatus Izemoplasmatales bacterium]|jgi:tRNA (guanine37-N1)-methyltransferase|nr:tRNA (guanosine(37)-N1)-methyltransferase TrmD [Candidatus Izemoplasmatales bacterium]MDD4354426.1 tRNA (guanosine(37)-N1)-methyltransferase TrmD [Candidatus Izemoplasmatales bacterium]MDD4987541.1 tRNA (guanosine(37)-N1)-methyltransferase TrmD [Candidatus Izemoplasmatales bacterium]NLF48611.1 tRNA (guanosine(37)-N1)-methyltransferase TrmD [Acholeplasmataceae bacterium]